MGTWVPVIVSCDVTGFARRPYQDEQVAQVATHKDEDEMDSDNQQLWRPDLRIVFLLILGKFRRLLFFSFSISKSQTLVCFILHVGVHVVYVKQRPLLLKESIAAARN